MCLVVPSVSVMCLLFAFIAGCLGTGTFICYCSWLSIILRTLALDGYILAHTCRSPIYLHVPEGLENVRVSSLLSLVANTGLGLIS